MTGVVPSVVGAADAAGAVSRDATPAMASTKAMVRTRALRGWEGRPGMKPHRREPENLKE
jgi:hypothetical protein